MMKPALHASRTAQRRALSSSASTSRLVSTRASNASPLLPPPTTTFNDGSSTKLPPIINGCWTLAGGHGQEVYKTIDATLEKAASLGYTTFDTADIYGQSESILGAFQSRWNATHDASSSHRVTMLTKYVPNIYQGRVTTASVQAAIKRSLTNLQSSTLDAVQLHWWDPTIPGMVDVALALTDLKAKGLIKSIGATNMNCDMMAQMWDKDVPLVCNQVQFSLLDRRPMNGMVQFCAERNIKLLTYGSVGGGLLSDKFVETPKRGLLGGSKYSTIDLNTSSLKMYWNVVKMFGGQELYRELLQTLRTVADRHGVSVAAVALRWVMDRGQGMVHPIVGLRSERHFEDNASVLRFTLDANDLQLIDGVLGRATGPEGDIYSFERGV